MAEAKEKKQQNMSKKKYITAGISILLSCIYISLAASLETWSLTENPLVLVLLWIIGVPLGAVLTWFFMEKGNRQLWAHALVCGVMMSAAYVCGCRLRRDGTVLAGIGKLPIFIVELLFLTMLSAVCVAPFIMTKEERRRIYGESRIGKRIEKWMGKCRETLPEKLRSGDKARKNIYMFFLYAVIIFACWLPVFLAYYPSVFAYDAEGQLYQVIAHDYSTHHPLLHTLFLGAFFRLGGALGSYSLGMAMHSVAQMLLMAGAFAYTLTFLYQRKTSVVLRILLLVFYALFPTNSILALSTTKDVLFAALTLLYALFLWRFLVEGKEGYAGLVIVTVLMLLFRNNAVYALVASAPFVWLFLRRKERMADKQDMTVEEQAAFKEHMTNGKHEAGKRYALVTLVSLLIFMAAHMGLKTLTGASSGSPREMLSVPLQQMARVRVEHEEELEPWLREEVEGYLPSEWVFAAYNPYLADPVKNRAVIHDNPAGLIKTWVKMGVRFPQTYVDAFLDNSIGYWFLEDTTHSRIYGIGTESGFGYLSTDNRTMPAGCEIVEHSFLPGLRAFLENIVSENAYQKIPVLSVIFAPAFYWWLLAVYVTAACYRKAYEKVAAVFFFLMYYLTLLLSPTVLIRYMYPFVVTVPALLCLTSSKPEGGSALSDR